MGPRSLPFGASSSSKPASYFTPLHRFRFRAIEVSSSTSFLLLLSDHSSLFFYSVYSACLLGSHRIPLAFVIQSDPLFFVEVNDINAMQTLEKYIACTSEKIFEIKKNLYDIFVDRQTIHANQKHGFVARVTASDLKRWKVLEAKLKANPETADATARE